MKPDTHPSTPSGLLSARSARITALVVVVLCALLLAGELTYEKKPYFGFDDFFGLYPIVGFVTVLLAVGLARLLRPLIGRHVNYYGEAGPSGKQDLPARPADLQHTANAGQAKARHD